jgi:hypothetical protein
MVVVLYERLRVRVVDVCGCGGDCVYVGRWKWTDTGNKVSSIQQINLTAIHLTLLKTQQTGYIAKAGDFKAKGVDEIVVLSVNDCFVMRAWEKTFDTDKVI